MIATCDRPVKAKGLCNRHYQRQRAWGDPLGGPPPRRSTLAERMNEKVDRSAGADACWPYTGTTQHGYGLITDGPRQLKAHRVAYELWVGPIPAGMTLDHECHNAALAAGLCSPGACEHRACCNPRHLAVRTIKENTMRGGGLPPQNRRKETCPRGHVLVPLPSNPDHRTCPACQADAARRWQDKAATEQVTCPGCEQEMLRISLASHQARHCEGPGMGNYQRQGQTTPTARCAYCPRVVTVSNIRRHQRQFHAGLSYSWEPLSA